MRIETQIVGEIEKIEVIQYSLIDDNFKVNILNYGGIITGIWTLDNINKLANVVVSYNDINFYQNNTKYLGAIIGRTAGRIANASFNLEGKKYKLNKNHGLHNLHGGDIGLHNKFWQVEQLSNGLKLKYLSPHLEEGFPGEIFFQVTYAITDNNELTISYYATTNQVTIINLTNHSYFNLAANYSSIENHLLQINALSYAQLNKDSIPTGKLLAAKNCFDFTNIKAIGQDINDNALINTQGYDHPYLLDKSKKTAAILIESTTGRRLQVTTSEDYLVFYSGNYLEKIANITRYGLCLETQNIPNAINLANTKSIYSPSKPYSSKTIYKFDVCS